MMNQKGNRIHPNMLLSCGTCHVPNVSPAPAVSLQAIPLYSAHVNHLLNQGACGWVDDVGVYATVSSKCC